MSDTTAPVPPPAPAMPPAPPDPAGRRKRSLSALKVAAGALAVASLVTTAVFTVLIWAQHPDTVGEYEEQRRLLTCASAHTDPKTWGEDTDGLDCHKLYDMPKKAWDDTYGVNHPSNRPSDDSSGDSSDESDSSDGSSDSGVDTSGMTYDECMENDDTTLADCQAISESS
ncbi:hypothetical protein [Streptomyces ficellus]|uniref:Uncharacterized protein n=1 Tax=Streptomyces ficellus TaxID=1977088 RepID=A0A6I6FRQ0_9ACTN|nr:hypothetical protein [Streptomyces ficellus]QGV80358.1 hypothetical protein EIZ62_20570 [Streptomyces ficellus]